MSSTANLDLPHILPAQAQKHVTHNEALERLDALTQMVVEAFDLADPPVAPVPGAGYGVAAGATGAWAGQDGALAFFGTGGWQFLTPRPGWRAWSVAAGEMRVYSGGTWLSVVSFDTLESVGINASADAVNRLSLAAAASLFSHDGAGHQIKVNKAAAGDTAALLFQTGYQGRAEIGLAGEEDLSIKVSDDGATFATALRIRRADGLSEMPCLRSGTVSPALGAVADIPTPGTGGMIAINLVDADFPQTSHSGIFSYDTGSTLDLRSLAVAPGFVNMGSAVLAGTTGTDARTNLSAQPGVIQVENRYKVDAVYSYTFLNAF